MSGVYAGVNVTLSVIMGGGMNRSDEVLLLRPDGTFNDDLSKPDWKTWITGRYTVSGNTLTLRYDEKVAIQYQSIEIDRQSSAEVWSKP